MLIFSPTGDVTRMITVTIFLDHKSYCSVDVYFIIRTNYFPSWELIIETSLKNSVNRFQSTEAYNSLGKEIEKINIPFQMILAVFNE